MITPGDLTPETYPRRSETLLKTIDRVSALGISAVQLREKRIPAKMVFDLAERTNRLLEGRKTITLVNERFDVAIAAGCDGVHLTSSSIPVAMVRQQCPKGFLIGISTHSLREVEEARAASADLAVFGPVFETPGKPAPEGGDRLEDLRAAVEASGDMLLLGLGGVDGSNAGRVLGTGADGIAAIRSLNDVNQAREILHSKT